MHEYGPKTTPVFLLDDGEASWLLLPSSITLIYTWCLTPSLTPPPLHMYLMDGHVTDSSQLNQVRYFANWQFLFIYVLFILLKCTKLTYCYKQGISWYKRSWKPAFSQLSQSNFFPMEYSLLSNRYKLVHFVPLLFVIINDSFHCEPISTAVKHNCSGVKNPYFWPFIPFWLLL